MKTIFVLLCALLTAAWSVSAAAFEISEGALRTFDIPTAEMLGRKMQRYDQAAWKATDRLREQKIDLAKEGVRGWITEETSSGVSAIFVAERNGRNEAAYLIRFPAENSAGEVIKMPAGTLLTQKQQDQFAARQTVIKNFKPKEQCAESFNTIIVEDPQKPGWIVYVMSATFTPGIIIAGGHYRATVSRDGKTLFSIEPMSKSCLNMDPQQGLEKDSKIAALGMTNLIFDTPSEAHVFLNLSYQIPLLVRTTTRMWQVENGTILPLDPK